MLGIEIEGGRKGEHEIRAVAAGDDDPRFRPVPLISGVDPRQAGDVEGPVGQFAQPGSPFAQIMGFQTSQHRGQRHQGVAVAGLQIHDVAFGRAHGDVHFLAPMGHGDTGRQRQGEPAHRMNEQARLLGHLDLGRCAAVSFRPLARSRLRLTHHGTAVLTVKRQRHAGPVDIRPGDPAGISGLGGTRSDQARQLRDQNRGGGRTDA